MRTNRASTSATPGDGRSPRRDADLLHNPAAQSADTRDRRADCGLSACGHRPIVRRDSGRPEECSPRTRLDSGRMRRSVIDQPAIARSRPANKHRNPARAIETRSSEYTKSISHNDAQTTPMVMKTVANSFFRSPWTRGLCITALRIRSRSASRAPSEVELSCAEKDSGFFASLRMTQKNKERGLEGSHARRAHPLCCPRDTRHLHVY